MMNEKPKLITFLYKSNLMHFFTITFWLTLSFQIVKVKVFLPVKKPHIF